MDLLNYIFWNFNCKKLTEILGLLSDGVCECARRDILMDPQSSTLLSHQVILSPSLFDDFKSKIKGSVSEDEDNNCEIRLLRNDSKWFNHQSFGNFISFWVGPKFLKFLICIALKPKPCIGGFGCEVYLSINGCEKICINAISMHENFDHLWLSSSSHWPLQNKFNDSNPFVQNHVEVL